MSLSASDLEAFVASVRERSAGIDSERAVELRVVEPFLERLGWDVRGPGVDPQAEVGGVQVSYLLSVDGAPEIAVQTAAPGADVESEQVPGAVEALHGGPVDWAIVTDGQRYVFLASSDGDVHRQHRQLEELPEATGALQHYTRAAASRRAKRQRTDRVAALRRLAARRSDAVDEVAASIAEVAGEAIEDDARAAARSLVDELLAGAPDGALESDGALDSDGASAPESDASSRPQDLDPGDESSRATGTASSDGARSADSATSADGPAGSDESTAPATPPHSSDRRDATAPDSSTAPAASGGTGSPTPPAPTARSAGDGEYVVRFFGGNASVGAVGTDNPAGTLVGVVRYLVENQGLVSSLTLPWGVESDRAVIAATPEHPDGSAMQYYESIEDRWYVWTGGDEARIRTAIEDLAEVAGLRVMFQGDW